MAESTKTENAQPAAAANATPAATGGTPQQAERTFTQAEVNQIVADRLARERKSASNEPVEPTAEETRARELDSREAALSCREYITEKGYPAKLLEVFPTNDSKAFAASVEKLLETFPEITAPPSNIKITTGSNARPLSVAGDMIDKAFSRKGLF